MSAHRRAKSLEPNNMDDRCGHKPTPSSSDDSAITKTSAVAAGAQCSTVSVYRAKINGVTRVVTVVWSKNLMNQSFTISIGGANGGSGADDAPVGYKVELKPWPFWGRKGVKTLDVDGGRADIFWDLRSAKFTASPEPAGGYYVAVVSQEEVVLLLGDCHKDAYKRTKSRPSLEDAVLVCKRESVSGKRSFPARARFDASRRKEHEILVESSFAGPKEPEMWITVDGYVVVHVKNLQWKFRGNATVLVEQAPVQVFWDVHDWVFAGPGSQAVFVFKPGAPPDDLGEEEGGDGGDKADGIQSAGEGDASGFCFFLHAWKME